jgi:hypothetical protein
MGLAHGASRAVVDGDFLSKKKDFSRLTEVSAPFSSTPRPPLPPLLLETRHT